MKLTLKTDYALRTLILLKSKDKATIKEIAEYYNIKKNHLSIVVNKLSELGYINSVTGPRGGVSLKPKTLNKNLGEIIRAFEDFELAECFNKNTNKCRLSPTCKLKSILKRANQNFLRELDQYTLNDI